MKLGNLSNLAIIIFINYFSFFFVIANFSIQYSNAQHSLIILLEVDANPIIDLLKQHLGD